MVTAGRERCTKARADSREALSAGSTYVALVRPSAVTVGRARVLVRARGPYLGWKTGEPDLDVADVGPQVGAGGEVGGGVGQRRASGAQLDVAVQAALDEVAPDAVDLGELRQLLAAGRGAGAVPQLRVTQLMLTELLDVADTR